MADDLALIGLGLDTGPLRQGQSELDRLGEQGDRAERRLGTATGRMRSHFERLSGVMRQAGALLAVFGAGAGLRGGIGVIGDFTESLSGVQAVTRSTDEQMAAMEETARQLGATTRFSAAQAAEGMRFLGMAGFDTNQIIAAMPSVLNLATAAALDLGSASDITSNIMSAFGVRASETGRIADALALSASSANTDVRQMGDAMSFVGPVAASLNVSMEDAAAAIGALSNAGIQGSAAGTGLRRVLSSLASPTKAARQAMARFGVSMEEVNPEARSLTEIVDTLADANLDAATAFEVFGDRGAPAILALTSQRDELRELTDTINDADGAAQDMADTMNDNLRGDALAAVSALQELVLAIGDAGATGALRGLVQGITGVLRALGGMLEEGEKNAALYKTIATVIEGVVALIGVRLVAALATATAATAKQTVAIVQNISATIAKNKEAVRQAEFQRAAAVAELQMARSIAATTGSMEAQRAAALRLQQAHVAYTAAVARASTATNVLRGAMALLGGPVGIAVAAASALLIFGSNAAGASTDTQTLREEVQQLTGAYQELQVSRIDEAMERVTQAIRAQEREIEKLERRFSHADFGMGLDRLPVEPPEIREAREEIQRLEQDLQDLREAREKALSDSGESSPTTTDPADTTEKSDALDDYLKKLREEQALIGVNTRAEKARVAISRGALGELTQAQEEQVIALATEVDNKQRALEIDRQRTQELYALTDAIRQQSEAGMTEIEREREQYQRRLEELNLFLEEDRITRQTHKLWLEELETAHQERLAQIRNQYQGQILSQYQTFLKQMEVAAASSGADQVNTFATAFAQIFAAGSQHNRKMFELNKVAGIAQAIISTYIGANKALELGWPLGPIAAAAITASGMARVQAIRSQSYGGGGGGSAPSHAGSTSAPPVAPVQPQQPEPERRTDLTIRLDSRRTTYGREDLEQIAEGLTELAQDGWNIGGVRIA